MNGVIRIGPDSLRSVVTAIFLKLGEDQAGAIQAANVLVEADLRGIEIEGVALLPPIMQAYDEGKLKPQAKWNIVRESPATATIDADRGLVCVLGPDLMALAIEKARNVGVGVVTMYNGGDAGRLGYYAALAAAQNMVGIVASAQGLRAVPVFGSEPRFGTNPIAIAAPSKSEVPLIFDTATTASAFGWLRNAYRDGVPFPEGTIAELDGTPVMTQVPSRPPGSYHLLPLGGDRQHGAQKGYGFSLMVEVLATMLSGSLPSMIDPDAGSRCFFAALNVAAFADPDAFLHNMDEVLRTLRTTPPARGHDRVLYPGLHGYEQAIDRTTRGIPIHHDVVNWFDNKCRELSISALKRM